MLTAQVNSPATATFFLWYPRQTATVPCGVCCAVYNGIDFASVLCGCTVTSSRTLSAHTQAEISPTFPVATCCSGHLPCFNLLILVRFSRLAAVFCWWASNNFTYFLFKIKTFHSRPHNLSIFSPSFYVFLFAVPKAGFRAIGPTDAIGPGDFGGPSLMGRGNSELVIFKYTPCVTTQSSRTDFVFKC